MVLEESDGAALLLQRSDLAFESFVERQFTLLGFRRAVSLRCPSLHRCRRGLSHEAEREQANE